MQSKNINSVVMKLSWGPACQTMMCVQYMVVLLQSFFQDFAQEGENDVMEYRGGQSGMILKGCYCAKHNQHAMLMLGGVRHALQEN